MIFKLGVSKLTHNYIVQPEKETAKQGFTNRYRSLRTIFLTAETTNAKIIVMYRRPRFITPIPVDRLRNHGAVPDTGAANRALRLVNNRPLGNFPLDKR